MDLGIDGEFVEKRQNFLLARAGVHRELAERDDRHVMVAATLQRDAACVALLRDDVDGGRHHLIVAGNDLLRSGATSGAALMALAGAEPDLTAAWMTPREMLSTAQTEREMLSMAQTDLLLQAQYGNGGRAAEQMGHLLAGELGGAPAGNAGLTIRQYVEIGQQGVDGHLDPQRVRDWLAPTWARRSRDIEKAKADQYHWRLLHRPSELLELDSVILATILLRTGQYGALWNELRDPPGNLVRAPLTAAEWLSGGDEWLS